MSKYVVIRSSDGQGILSARICDDQATANKVAVSIVKERQDDIDESEIIGALEVNGTYWAQGVDVTVIMADAD